MPVGGDNTLKSGVGKKRKYSSSFVKGVTADLTPLLLSAVRKGSQVLQRKDSKTNTASSELVDSYDEAVAAFLDKAKLESSSVHVSCLTFLVDTVENLGYPWEVRISALRLTNALLHRSKSAREFFVEGRVGTFVKIVSQGTGKDENRTTFANLLQEEAAKYLSMLSSRFGQFYPRLIVACRWMDEKKGIRFNQSAGRSIEPIGLSVLQRRIGRDNALINADKECAIVKRLISKVDECFKRLIPDLCDDEDDFDNVDWEEGDEELTLKAQRMLEDGTEHEMAVERTIAAMGIRENIHIDVSRSNFCSSSSSGQVEQNDDILQHKYLSKLERYTKLIYKHHQQVSFWIESLSTADDVPLPSLEGSIKQDLGKVSRRETLTILFDIKNDLARVITQASKLGVSQQDDSSYGVTTDCQRTERVIAWSR